MYDLSDTIVAVSSPGGGVRSIVRLTGPQTLATCAEVFESGPQPRIRDPQSAIRTSVVLPGEVRINDDLAVDARLYLFFAPHSYTGEDLAEIHVHGSPVLVEALIQNLLARGLRPAGPGEFTARAYFNGKLDLAQAEAVNEVISSSNRLQLEAAETLLGGRLTQAADEIHADLLDVLSRIEAGLDFSGEDLEFIGRPEAVKRLAGIQQRLEELLAGSIRCATLVELPAVGIAGVPNAGKSSLLNALLGWERSIVAPRPGTTRDVLAGVLTTDRFQCVLFDCAGLVGLTPPPSGVSVEPGRGRLDCLDELAQRAAIEALRNCAAVLFCVDSAKTDLREDLAIYTLLTSVRTPHGDEPANMIHVATKSDLLHPGRLLPKAEELPAVFHAAFVPVSARTASGLRELLGLIERMLIDGAAGAQPAGRVARTERHPVQRAVVCDTHPTDDESALHPPPSEISSTLALTARHRQAMTEAIESARQSVVEVQRGNEEVAVMMIRAACQAISQIEQHSLDEQVLDRIFSRFCIGK
jgi:tRNA modification GTPase